MRRILGRASAVFLFALVAGLVAMAVLMGWNREAPDRGRFVVEIRPGEVVDYSLGPEVARLRVVSRVVLEADHLPADARRSRNYPLDVTWLAPSGEVRREARMWERTRVSRWPDGTAEPLRSGDLVDDERLVTDARTTELPASDVLPGGGLLRLGVPPDGEPIVLRVFGAREPGEVSSSSVKAEELARAARRVGLPDVHLLEPAERRQLLDENWRSLPFAATENKGRLQRLRRHVPELAPREEAAAGTVLTPGQSVAINVVGPTRLRVSGGPGVNALLVETLADVPAEEQDLDPAREPAQPVPLPGMTHGYDLSIPHAAATTITFTNPTGRNVGPLVFTLPTDDPARLYAWTPAVRPGDLPGGRERDYVYVGPERVAIPGVRIGSHVPMPLVVEVPLGAPVLRFDVRPELDGPTDVRPRSITIAELDERGEVRRQDTYEIAAWPAPFERRSEDGGWVGDPVKVELEPSRGTARMRVTSESAMRVMPYVDGPPRGEDHYPLEHEELWRVRYARDAEQTWWRHWPPDTQALAETRQLVQTLANVRIEGRAPSDAYSERLYSGLAPLGGIQLRGRVWLVEGENAFDLAWCRYPAGSSLPLPWDARTRRLRHSELRGVLHTPSIEALGQPWSIELDGRVWKQGRVLQRVEILSSFQEPGHSAARLEAPSGSVLWLRARDTEACPDARRGVEAWPLGAGGEARLPMGETWEARRILVGGFAKEPVTVEVALEGLGEPFPGASQDAAFRQEVVLRPGETLGQRLTDPDMRLPQLETEMLRIGADVPELVLRVRHLDGPPLWLRVLVEVDALTPPAPPRSARMGGS